MLRKDQFSRFWPIFLPLIMALIKKSVNDKKAWYPSHLSDTNKILLPLWIEISKKHR